MSQCFVDGCFNSGRRKKRGVTFYSFPNRMKLKWLAAIGRDVNTFITQQTICSEHFRPEDFEGVGISKRIKANVVPSVNLPVEAANVDNIYDSVISFLQPFEDEVQMQNSPSTAISQFHHPSTSASIMPLISTSSATDKLKDKSDPLCLEDNSLDLSSEEDIVILTDMKECIENATSIADNKLNLSNSVHMESESMSDNSATRVTGLRQNLEAATCKINFQQKEIKALKQKVKRLKTKVISLKMLFTYLKNNHLVNDAGYAVIEAFTKR